MGSGKSTIATHLSEQIGFDYIEMDEEIERKEGMSIARIFEKYGEKYFRQSETNLLKSLEGSLVVSTGGGIILAEENQQLLKSADHVFFLNASFDTIHDRLINDEDRPLWSDNIKKNKLRFEERLPIYHGLAKYVIQVDGKDSQAITDEILNCLK